MSAAPEPADVQAFFAEWSGNTMVERNRDVIRTFIERHAAEGRRVAVVTSGGTTIPFEENTVRYLDNFSGGNRGSASAEAFLAEGYAVIFLYRRHSLQPFARRFDINSEIGNFLDFLVDRTASSTDTSICVESKYARQVGDVLSTYNAVKKNNLLLKVTFVTIQDYLCLLRESMMLMRPLGTRGVLFAAAAVSDFYLKPHKIVTHKIQSSSGALTVEFDNVPKMLGCVLTCWAPESFVVSFKLETDQELLVPKVKRSMKRDGQQMVVGNILGSHKTKVQVFSHDEAAPTRIELQDGEADIEPRLVKKVAAKHTQYIEIVQSK